MPIPGTTKVSRLEENIDATAVELTGDVLHRIDTAAAAVAIVGARYPEEQERRTYL